jgi:hypothetical protein
LIIRGQDTAANQHRHFANTRSLGLDYSSAFFGRVFVLIGWIGKRSDRVLAEKNKKMAQVSEVLNDEKKLQTGISSVNNLTSLDNERDLENSVDLIFAVKGDATKPIFSSDDSKVGNKAEHLQQMALLCCNRTCANNSTPGEGAGKCSQCGGLSLCLCLLFFLINKINKE